LLGVRAHGTLSRSGGGNEEHMRVSLPTRRPPGLLEQLLGRRRARIVRRRLGFVALGVGYSLLKPRSRVAPVAVVAGALTLLVVVTRV
jgi:hypothetical protein